MHYEFCTLFDRNYLFKGLALHESLQRHVGDFTLWVLCMDDIVYEVLEKMRLPEIKLISLAQFEDEDLLRAKATRTQVEYCWTCTPSLPLYLLNHVASIEAITYLDADLWFFGNLAQAYAEMGDWSVGIVEHRYSADLAYLAEDYGIYNVQFMVFRNDERAATCLKWWRERCNEWCYHRVEEGKYGDQKYLDGWPERFDGVLVFQGKGVGLAPWNLQRYAITKKRGRLVVDGQPLVFFHFHSFTIANGGHRFKPAYSSYKVTKRNVRLIYRPYFLSIRRALVRSRRTEPDYAHGISSQRLDSPARAFVQRIRRRMGSLTYSSIMDPENRNRRTL